MILKEGEKYKLKRDLYSIQKGTIVEYSYNVTPDIYRFFTIPNKCVVYLRLHEIEPLDSVKIGHRRTKIFC